MAKPTEAERLRAAFLAAVWQSVRIWQDEPPDTQIDRVEGLAFSLLVTLDGMTADALPGFNLVSRPGDVCINEGVELHAEFYEARPKPRAKARKAKGAG